MAGKTQTVAPANFTAPITFEAKNSGVDKFRSITITNQTTNTTVSVFFGGSGNLNPILVVAPGQYITAPFAPQNQITFTASNVSGALEFPGASITLHADDTPLSASGFSSGMPQVVSTNAHVNSSATTNFPWAFFSGTFPQTLNGTMPGATLIVENTSAQTITVSLTRLLTGGIFVPNTATITITVKPGVVKIIPIPQFLTAGNISISAVDATGFNVYYLGTILPYAEYTL